MTSLATNAASLRVEPEVAPAAQPEGDACPICCSGHLGRDISTSRVTVRRCGRCGHSVATHEFTEISEDYHRQYEQGEFLESLAITRQLQAEKILGLLRRFLPSADDVLDFGAGRGWFLEACRRAGMRIAGADTSIEAVASLRRRDIPAFVVPVSASDSLGLNRLPFRPRVLTLLDVVEHLPPEDVFEILGRLLCELGARLELVVVKVPVADGFLYRISRALASGFVQGPIEQLYQVGTFPPHFSYFTRASMRRLMARQALRVLAEVGLVELDRETARGRVGSLRRLPPRLGYLAGTTLSTIAEYMSRDSVVFIAARTS